MYVCVYVFMYICALSQSIRTQGFERILNVGACMHLCIHESFQNKNVHCTCMYLREYHVNTYICTERKIMIMYVCEQHMGAIDSALRQYRAWHEYFSEFVVAGASAPTRFASFTPQLHAPYPQLSAPLDPALRTHYRYKYVCVCIYVCAYAYSSSTLSVKYVCVWIHTHTQA